MKKLLCVLICVTMVLSLVSCIDDNPVETEETEQITTDNSDVEPPATIPEEITSITEEISQIPKETEKLPEENIEPIETESPFIESIGQKNALKSAQSYLKVSAFSLKGLIEQLEYEGYSNEEATYGAENSGADWFEQAVKSAKNYLDIMAFSRISLIEQLEYEGFTNEQAVYGVEQNGY